MIVSMVAAELNHDLNERMSNKLPKNYIHYHEVKRRRPSQTSAGLPSIPKEQN